MNTQSLFLSIGFMLVSAAGLSAQVVEEDPQAIDIRLRYQAGKTYKVITEMSTRTEMDIGGEKMTSDQVMTFVSDNKVTAIEGSENLNLLMTYTRVAMVMDMMGERIVYDSADETQNGNNEFADMVGNFVGVEINMEVDPGMKIKEIEGLEKLFEESEFGDMDDEEIQTMKEDHVELLSGAEFSALVPGKPVREGAEWPYSTTMSMPMMGTLEISGTSTLREVSLVDGRLQAVVDMSAKGKTVVDNAEAEEGEGEEDQPADPPGVGQVRKMDLKGEYIIDIQNGYVVEATVESDTIFMMGVGDGAVPMELPMKTTTKTLTSME